MISASAEEGGEKKKKNKCKKMTGSIHISFNLLHD
jgi:hypothetical protein